MNVELPNYIDGNFKFEGISVVNKNILLNNRSSVTVHLANEWDIIAAVETASRIHGQLNDFNEYETLYFILKRAIDKLDLDIKFMAEMTGSPVTFIRDRINETRDWINDSHNFLKQAIIKRKIEHYRSNPTFAILPSNSEQEALFVIAQTLAAKSPLIIRASSSGLSSYTAIKFAEAWKEAVNEYPYGYLKGAISVINTKGTDDLWKNISIDGWNYICFGSGDTINKIKGTIYNQGVKPRKIISYGSNLSGSVIDKSIVEFKNLEDLAEIHALSASINRGNECVAPRVAYVHEDIFEDFYSQLAKQVKKYKSLSPLNQKSIGIVKPDDAEYIKSTLTQQNKIKHLNSRVVNGSTRINASVVPLTIYEHPKELPGPVLYLKPFKEKSDLLNQMNDDLAANNEEKFLVLSIYSSNQFNEELSQHARTYKVRHNKPSHEVDLSKPHQGVILLEELIDPITLE